MKLKMSTILKSVFVLGVILDSGVSLSWFLIAYGIEIPSILSGYTGNGQDYQFAMYVSAMFMAGCAVRLGWGALDPVNRKGLLVITAIFLLISVVIELVFYSNVLGGSVFVFGVSKRIFLVILFSTVYFYSYKQNLK